MNDGHTGRSSEKGSRTPEAHYRAEVEGDIENVKGVLRIIQVCVDYHLTAGDEKAKDAREAFASYLLSCPAAQSVIGCIDIKGQSRPPREVGHPSRYYHLDAGACHKVRNVPRIPSWTWVSTKTVDYPLYRVSVMIHGS